MLMPSLPGYPPPVKGCCWARPALAWRLDDKEVFLVTHIPPGKLEVLSAKISP